MPIVAGGIALDDLGLHGAGKAPHQGRHPHGYLGSHSLGGIDENPEEEVDDDVDAGPFQQPCHGTEQVPGVKRSHFFKEGLVQNKAVAAARVMPLAVKDVKAA